MSHSSQFYRFKKITIIGLLLLGLSLACGPLDRLQAVNRRQQAAATAETLLAQSDLIPRAFQAMRSLPGYRLEIRLTPRLDGGLTEPQRTIIEVDAAGNQHIQRQSSGKPLEEMYRINDQFFQFDPQYNGWVVAGNAATTPNLSNDGQTQLDLLQLLAQIGTAPVKTGQEMLDSRSTTRYRLSYLATELARALNRPSLELPLQVEGNLWIDDVTGALVKLELDVYQEPMVQPAQSLRLAVSQIGEMGPFSPPTPVVDPAAMVAATATAQAWTVLAVTLDYRGDLLTFELIPLSAAAVLNASPRRADVRVRLRGLPDSLLAQPAQFLSFLRQHVRLSIPQQNLIVTSSGFQPVGSNLAGRTLDVVYSFNADLQDLNGVELIVAGVGNPLYAPLPVD